jgi:diphthamide biosynthesis protein 7
LFGVATSTGSIGIYELNPISGKAPSMTHIRTIDYFGPKILVTAFSWHPDGNAVGMTHTSGELCLASYTEESLKADPRGVQVWQHMLEAWTLVFLPDGSGVLSGADDSTLQFTELPRDPVEALDGGVSEPKYFSTRRAQWVDEKIHGAGVTAILPVYCDEESILVVTGSYDDRIRLVHASTTGRRKTLAELNLGGGVWRMKVLDTKTTSRDVSQGDAPLPVEFLLLVSCMHAGSRIVRLVRREETWEFEVLAKFEEHKSMNYGSDSQPDANERGQRTFVSTSFYDRLLCLWRY